ncbi:MAG: hypothetical protein ACRD3M_09390 [Thermoanaerobaculia bacterium]
MNWSSLLAAAAAAVPVAAGILWDEGFGQAALWADGNAEVSTYHARDTKYGIARASRAILVVVAEDFRREELVKADRPEGEPRTRRVLKLNHVRAIPTGLYTYQQMLSVFLGARRLEPVKLTVTSHEWCGNSFIEWREDRRLLSIRSYFESVADRDLPLWPADALFYDELPLKLRSLDFDRTREGKVTVIDSLFSNNPSPPSFRPAKLTVTRGAPGIFRVALEREGARDLFEFNAEFPHRLRRWERSDGGLLTLVDSRRIRYWEKNLPGDENLLPAAPAR